MSKEPQTPIQRAAGLPTPGLTQQPYSNTSPTIIICVYLFQLYWPSLKRCIKSSEALKKCTGKDQLVKADAFGDGFCTCDDESGTFEVPNRSFTVNTLTKHSIMLSRFFVIACL